MPRQRRDVAEKTRVDMMLPRAYQPIEGLAAYNQAVQKLLFGADSQLLADGRVVTIEALGGTGALKVGADYLVLLRLVNVASTAVESSGKASGSGGEEVLIKLVDAAAKELLK